MPPERGSTSSTASLERGPVTSPMLLSGHRSHQPRMTSGSVLGLLLPAAEDRLFAGVRHLALRAVQRVHRPAVGGVRERRVEHVGAHAAGSCQTCRGQLLSRGAARIDTSPTPPAGS